MRYPTKFLTDDETVLVEFHPHWRTLLAVAGWGSLAATLAAGCWWASARFAHPAADVGPLVAAAAGGVWALYAAGKLTVWATTSYVLTTERLIARSGVLSRRGTEIPLEQINTVSFSQRLYERLFGYGDLTIESAAQGKSQLADIPHPEAFQSRIYAARDARTGARPADGSGVADVAGQLERLADLHERGVLTDDEFVAHKRRLLEP